VVLKGNQVGVDIWLYVGWLHGSVIWGNTERRIRFDLSIHKILTTS